MRATTRAIALALFLLTVFGLPAFALDGCPRGEFTLEGGCVLCLPGYSPQKTGHTNPQGQACYACLRDKAAADPDEPPVCADPRPIDGAAGPAGALESTL